MATFLTAALYKFVHLPDFAQMREPLLEDCLRLGIKGTLLLAEEGINGTVCGSHESIRQLLERLRSDPRLADLEHKESAATQMPFYRMKVRLKSEIVTMGVCGIDPVKDVGRYVEPEDWNALISQPDVVLIDTRNDYEVAIGTFRGAINPATRSFRELPQWLRQQESLKNKPRVAMFCTGGIRCEKSTAFLRSEGFSQVYHLKGGILKYLEKIPASQSLWEGECFVFDERVSLGHGLVTTTSHTLCRACRQPLSDAERASPLYREGISCPHCHDHTSEAKKQSLAERQKQVELAAKRGQSHIGSGENGEA